MLRRLIATLLSLLLLIAAAISLNDELALPESASAAAGEQPEIALAGSNNEAVPDYPDGISQRLLRKRVSHRALIGERSGAVISAGYVPSPLQFCVLDRSFPQALYHHQTSLRI
jgi:hypothetical protein